MICTSIKIKDCMAEFTLPKSINFAEYRFDDTELTPKEINKIINNNNIRAIATYRSDIDNDNIKFNTLVTAIESGALYVDIEIDYNYEQSIELVKLARKYSVKVIYSYHNYFNTPDRPELEEILDSMLSTDADIFKIACKANSVNDTLRLLNLYSEKKTYKNIEGKLISLPIGNEWKIARMAVLELGAPFIYASLNKSAKTADGQIDFERLNTILDLLK